MKRAAALDGVIQYKNAARHPRPTAATKNRGMTALRTLNSKPMGLQHVVNHRDHVFVRRQGSKRKPGKRREFRFNRQPHRSMQAIHLLLKIGELCTHDCNRQRACLARRTRIANQRTW